MDISHTADSPAVLQYSNASVSANKTVTTVTVLAVTTPNKTVTTVTVLAVTTPNKTLTTVTVRAVTTPNKPRLHRTT